MLRVPFVSVIILARLAALAVAAFVIVTAIADGNIFADLPPGTAGWRILLFGWIVPIVLAVFVVFSALYAALRFNPGGGLRYIAFAVLLLPLFLMLPALTRTDDWSVSAILAGVLVLAAVACLLPDPIRAWRAMEPERR